MSDFEFDFELAEADLSAVESHDALGLIKVDLDAETHTIFTSQVTAYSAGQDLISKRDAVIAAGVAMEEKAKREKELKDQIEELRREFGKRLEILQAELTPIATEMWDLRAAKRQAERDVQIAEQKLRDALAFLQQQAKYASDAELFAQRTAGAPWREWAKDYQIEGARLLASADGKGILGDKMGLGKTLTSQILMDMIGAKKVLIIVPDDIVSNFLSEVSHWAPHRTAFLLGKQSKMQRDIIINLLKTQDQFTVIINYSAWRRDKALLDKIVRLQFDTVILDEAHSVKNTSTAAFKGASYIIKASNSCANCGGYIQHVHDNGDMQQVAGVFMPRDFYVCIGQHLPSSQTVDFLTVPVDNACGWSNRSDIVAGIKRKFGALRSVKHVLPMTGTPILNKPQDLFALLNLIDDETYHSEKDYLYNYCSKNVWTDKWEFRPGGLESLTKRLAGRYVARDKKTAGVILPKQEVIIHDIELDEELYPGQTKVIKQLSQHAMLMLTSGKKMAIVAMIALITRKRQANVWPAGIEIRDPETDMVTFSVGDDVKESIKLDRIIQQDGNEWSGMIPDFTGDGDKTNGERVVVFSQFKGPLRELERRLNAAGISVVRFDGDTPEDTRNEVKRDFDRKYASETDYKWEVVLANFRTGGVGLNFTAATQMIILDEEWNVGKNEQAYARVDRIGQTEETTVHILRLSNTIDTWLAELIENKRNMVEGFETNAEMQNELLRKMQNGEMM